MCGMWNSKCYLCIRRLTTKIFNTKCDCNIKVLNIIEFWIPRYDHPTINKVILYFVPLKSPKLNTKLGSLSIEVILWRLNNAKTIEFWIIFVIDNTIKFIGEFGFYGLKTYIPCYNICSMA